MANIKWDVLDDSIIKQGPLGRQFTHICRRDNTRCDEVMTRDLSTVLDRSERSVWPKSSSLGSSKGDLGRCYFSASWILASLEPEVQVMRDVAKCPYLGSQKSEKQIWWENVVPTASNGSSGMRLNGSEPGSLDSLDGGYGGMLLTPATVTSGIGVLTMPANGSSAKATIFGFDPLFESARPGSDDIETPVTIQVDDGHVLCHNVQIRSSPKDGCIKLNGNRDGRKEDFEPVGSLIPTYEIHPLFGSLGMFGTLDKLMDIRGGECSLDQWECIPAVGVRIRHADWTDHFGWFRL